MTDIDEMPKTQCPKCREWVDDFDGFGVLIHDECGYCCHPSASKKDGNWKCDHCKTVLEVSNL
jgi:hypothetical protein